MNFQLLLFITAVSSMKIKETHNGLSKLQEGTLKDSKFVPLQQNYRGIPPGNHVLKRVLNSFDTPTFRDSPSSQSYSSVSDSYNGPSPSFNSPSFSSYDIQQTSAPSPQIVYSVPVNNPSESSAHESQSVQNSYDSPPSNSSNNTVTHEVPSTYYGTTDPVDDQKKRLHKFKLGPVLVAYGFFIIGITWVFLRTAFFKQIGTAGNFKRSIDSWIHFWEDDTNNSSIESWMNNAIRAISDTGIFDSTGGNLHSKSR